MKENPQVFKKKSSKNKNSTGLLSITTLQKTVRILLIRMDFPSWGRRFLIRKFHGYRPLTDDKYVIVETSPEEIRPLVPAHDLMNEAILEDLPAPLLPSSSEPSPDKNGEVLDLFDPLVTTSPCLPDLFSGLYLGVLTKGSRGLYYSYPTDPASYSPSAPPSPNV